MWLYYVPFTICVVSVLKIPFCDKKKEPYLLLNAACLSLWFDLTGAWTNDLTYFRRADSPIPFCKKSQDAWNSANLRYFRKVFGSGPSFHCVCYRLYLHFRLLKKRCHWLVLTASCNFRNFLFTEKQLKSVK
jgi:hypothetical protein